MVDELFKKGTDVIQKDIGEWGLFLICGLNMCSFAFDINIIDAIDIVKIGRGRTMLRADSIENETCGITNVSFFAQSVVGFHNIKFSQCVAKHSDAVLEGVSWVSVLGDEIGI